jgi:hypothetical protein
MTTNESYYQKQLKLVERIYEENYAKNVWEMNPGELAAYQRAMDFTRWARVALESDRPVKQKIVDLTVQLSRRWGLPGETKVAS